MLHCHFYQPISDRRSCAAISDLAFLYCQHEAQNSHCAVESAHEQSSLLTRWWSCHQSDHRAVTEPSRLCLFHLLLSHGSLWSPFQSMSPDTVTVIVDPRFPITSGTGHFLAHRYWSLALAPISEGCLASWSDLGSTGLRSRCLPHHWKIVWNWCCHMVICQHWFAPLNALLQAAFTGQGLFASRCLHLQGCLEAFQHQTSG